jgi:hypothetical protein
VRRAEHHAETSAKDPRHIGVPRDLGDDILKKVRIQYSILAFLLKYKDICAVLLEDFNRSFF